MHVANSYTVCSIHTLNGLRTCVCTYYRSSTLIHNFVLLTQTQLMNISNEAEDVLRIRGYNISYISSTSGDIFKSTFIPIPDTTTMTFELVVSVPSACQNSAINVAVSAVNQLGQGPRSDHVAIGCTLNNAFVKVLYIRENNTISCIFQDRLDDENSCSVTYGQCGTSLNYSVPENRTVDSSGTTRLKLQPQFADQAFCYAVRATSATESIIIRGRVDKGKFCSGY